MGYCYDNRGRLACDSCGECGGVRKVKCPWGYCPASALCKACRAKHAERNRRYHIDAGCEREHLAYMQEQQERAMLIASGEYLLASALREDLDHDGGDPNMARLWFVGADGEKVVVVDAATYDSSPRRNLTLSALLTLGRVLEPYPVGSGECYRQIGGA